MSAHRREWMRPAAVGLGSMTGFFGVMVLVAVVVGDTAGVFAFALGVALTAFATALSSLRQKAFTVRGPLAVASDRLWPRAARSIHRFDLDDTEGFSVHEKPPGPGEHAATWELHVDLRDGKRLRLFSELVSRDEADWLHALATLALRARA